jgi:hypothetical protein
MNTYINNNKSKLIKYALLSIKAKKYSDFIFNEINLYFKELLVSFLDSKTLLFLTSSNKLFFRNGRYSLNNYFYNKLIKESNKETKKKFIYQVLDSTKKFCSEKVKQKLINKEIKWFYSKLLKKSEIYDDLILKVLPRTLPGDSNFRKGK